jgi:hypothetical protein
MGRCYLVVEFDGTVHPPGVHFSVDEMVPTDGAQDGFAGHPHQLQGLVEAIFLQETVDIVGKL